MDITSSEQSGQDSSQQQIDELQNQIKVLSRVLISEKSRFESQIVLLATRTNELEIDLKSKNEENEVLKSENAKISNELVGTKQKLDLIETKNMKLKQMNSMLCRGYELGKDSQNYGAVDMMAQIELLKSNLAKLEIEAAENFNEAIFTRNDFDEINDENLELKRQIRTMRFEERNAKRCSARKFLTLIKQNKSLQSDLDSQKEYVDELKEIICRQYYDLKRSNETACSFYVRNGRLLDEKQQIESMLSSANTKIDTMFDNICEFKQLCSSMKQENDDLKTRYNEVQSRNDYLESKLHYLSNQLNRRH